MIINDLTLIHTRPGSFDIVEGTNRTVIGYVTKRATFWSAMLLTGQRERGISAAFAFANLKFALAASQGAPATADQMAEAGLAILRSAGLEVQS